MRHPPGPHLSLMPPTLDIAKIRTEVEAVSTGIFNTSRQDLAYLTNRYQTQFKQITPLVDFILGRMDSVTLLMNAGKKWDANILWRSALEVFGKFLRITNPANEPALREEKLREFWVDINDIERMKDSNWAKKILATDRQQDSKLYEPFVLTEEEENILKAKPTYANRTYRKALGESWSFNNIFMKLAQEGKTFHLIPLTHMQHRYLILSHLVHGDAWGLKIINMEKRYDAETDAVNMLVEFIGNAKAANEMLIFMTLELAWIVGEKHMFQRACDRYIQFNPYVVNQAKIAMDELFRLQDERLP